MMDHSCFFKADWRSLHRIGVDVDFALKDTSAPIGSPLLHRNVEDRLNILFKTIPKLKSSMKVELHPSVANPDHIHIWFIR